MTGSPALARRLGTVDAVVIGLGSMIGAGIFTVFAPAATAAGAGLVIGLAIAAAVAWLNARSSARLAAQYPTSGGTYVYGREQLGPWWGFVAGWSFVIGKTASCAAMALTFAAYAAPEDWRRPAAVAAVVALTAVNYRGVTRTAQLARVIVIVALLALAVVVAAGASTGLPSLGEVFGASDDTASDDTASGAPDGPPGGQLSGAASGAASGPVSGPVSGPESVPPTPYGILQSAGLLFFAFAGYARIATMGEEVRNPARTIPRAIGIALAITVAVYALVAVAVLGALGAGGLAASTAPLADTVQESGWRWADPIVRIGASAASLGALLGLVTGVGRTSLAMAREGDLPRPLAAVHERYRVPHRAELVLAAIVVVLVVTIDVRAAIGFSSFGVLLYYFVANLAALRQARERRRIDRVAAVAGVLACAVLVVTLPVSSIVVGAGVVVIGVGIRVLLRRFRSSAGPESASRR